MALKRDREIETFRGGISCSVCRAIAEMTPEDAETLNGWLEAGIQYRVISRWLKEDNGLDLPYQRIGHHWRSCEGKNRGAR